MRPLSFYLSKIPPEHAGDANLIAEATLLLQPLVDVQVVTNSIPSLFDLDVAAGVQLDATGAWAGISRNVPVAIPNPWFSFDTQGLGFDQGYWFGPFDGIGLVALDDTTYRRLIRAKIAANNCNGLQASLQAALTAYFDPADYPNTNFAIYDATDPIGADGLTSAGPAMGLVVSGQIPNAVDLAILDQILAVILKPAGVAIVWGVTTILGAPAFGFDVENEYISGFDVGSWGADPTFVAGLSGFTVYAHPIMQELLTPVSPLDLGAATTLPTLSDDFGGIEAAQQSVDLGGVP